MMNEMCNLAVAAGRVE